MGRERKGKGHKKADKKKGGGKVPKGKQFKADNQFSIRRVVEENSKHDHAPKGDEDLIDIPKVRGASMFGGGAGFELFDQTRAQVSAAVPQSRKEKRKAAGSGEGQDGTRQPRKAKKAKKVEGEGSDDGMTGAEEDDETSGTPLMPRQALRKEELPKQRPGESAKAYSARVDRSLQQHLQASRRKMTTDRQREKRKEREVAKKKKAATAKGQVPDRSQPNRPRFGDVVQRPPILSSAAMKSRAKLKGDGADATKAHTDMSDYAAKVREAYDAMRKKRYGAAAAAF